MKKDTRIRNEAPMNNFNNSTTQQLNNSTSDGVAIRVDHVSKKYCKSLKRSMLYGVKDIARNILGLSSHSENLRKHEFWAVDDVSFKVKKVGSIITSRGCPFECTFFFKATFGRSYRQ